MARKIAKTEYLMKPVDLRLVAALIVLAVVLVFVFNMMRTAPSETPSGKCYSSSDCSSGSTCYIGIGENRCVDTQCGAYCLQQVHIMCVGQWNISGVYPDCRCQWLCEEGGPV